MKKTFFNIWADKILSADASQKLNFWRQIRQSITLADLLGAD